MKNGKLVVESNFRFGGIKCSIQILNSTDIVTGLSLAREKCEVSSLLAFNYSGKISHFHVLPSFCPGFLSFFFKIEV